MKNLALIVVSAFAVLLLRSSVSAQDASAVNVQTSCAHWAKVRVDKHKQFKGDSNDLYQTGVCLGYFDGLMDGMDNTGGWQLEDGTTAVLQIKRSAISSTWDVIRAFYTYVDANPLANGKPAWSVLQSVLRTNGLATVVPQASKAEPQASVLTDECKRGATNVLTQFSSDSDLKVIDTPTLASVVDKLIECWNTPHISDADSSVVLAATTEAQSVLVSRAIIVLKRHALMPEYKAENLGSTQNRTVSNAPSGVVTER
jgi:hypothetical protein